MSYAGELGVQPESSRKVLVDFRQEGDISSIYVCMLFFLRIP